MCLIWVCTEIKHSVTQDLMLLLKSMQPNPLASHHIDLERQDNIVIKRINNFPKSNSRDVWYHFNTIPMTVSFFLINQCVPLLAPFKLLFPNSHWNKKRAFLFPSSAIKQVIQVVMQRDWCHTPVTAQPKCIKDRRFGPVFSTLGVSRACFSLVCNSLIHVCIHACIGVCIYGWIIMWVSMCTIWQTHAEQ